MTSSGIWLLTVCSGAWGAVAAVALLQDLWGAHPSMSGARMYSLTVLPVRHGGPALHVPRGQRRRGAIPAPAHAGGSPPASAQRAMYSIPFALPLAAVTAAVTTAMMNFYRIASTALYAAVVSTRCEAEATSLTAVKVVAKGETDKRDPEPPPAPIPDGSSYLRAMMLQRALEMWDTIHRSIQDLLAQPIRRNEERVLVKLDSIVQEHERTAKHAAVVIVEDVVNEGEYAQLRGPFDAAKLEAFFANRQFEVALRISEIALAGLRVWRAWQHQEGLPPEGRTRGALLREELAGLGPVFLKIGQTLAQRPDIIGEEAAQALKGLQSRSPPYPSATAFAILAKDLNWRGPIAPNVPHPSGATSGRPLFKFITPEPVASASLGQVYRAETWEGTTVAVKIQRPFIIKAVAMDWVCWNRSLKALTALWRQETDLGAIADEVAVGVFNELSYEKEAAHAEEFNRLHGYLGYTRAPRCLPQYSGDLANSRVLAMEWIHGKTFRELPKRRQLLMAEMAVEACVTQMLNTGFVHADPHEGNMLLSDDDQLVFLDFGLITRLQPEIMESFAEGIQYMIAGNWAGITRVFQQVGFAPKDGCYRLTPAGYEKVDDAEFTAALQEAIEGQEGGTARFGALATGLAALSTRYRLLTPPYIILLCRTFLTLEGMAATADPAFNIYQASLPYAVRRAMSPSTPDGIEALRRAWLTDQGGVRWPRVDPLIAAVEGGPPDGAAAPTASGIMAERGALALSGLLGARDGRAVRRMLRDLDGARTVFEVARHPAVCRLGANMTTAILRSYLFKRRPAPSPQTVGGPPGMAADEELEEAAAPAEWYMSPEGRRIHERQDRRKAMVLRLLARSHLRRLLREGPRGHAALLLLAGLLALAAFQAALRVTTGAARDGLRALLRLLARPLTRRLRSPPVPAPA